MTALINAILDSRYWPLIAWTAILALVFGASWLALSFLPWSIPVVSFAIWLLYYGLEVLINGGRIKDIFHHAFEEIFMCLPKVGILLIEKKADEAYEPPSHGFPALQTREELIEIYTPSRLGAFIKHFCIPFGPMLVYWTFFV
jgi:hypothetical protein